MERFCARVEAAGLVLRDVRMRWSGPTRRKLDVRKIAAGRRLTSDGLFKLRVADKNQVVVSETHGAVSTRNIFYSKRKITSIFESVAGPDTAAAGWECTWVMLIYSYKSMCDLKAMADELGVDLKHGNLLFGNIEFRGHNVVFRGARDALVYADQLDRIGPVIQRHSRLY